MERRWRKERGRSFGPQWRSRLQHVGFDHMAPPGDWEYQTLSLLKTHTGSYWV